MSVTRLGGFSLREPMMIDHATSDLNVHDARQRYAAPALASQPAHLSPRVDVEAIRTPGLGDTTYILRRAGVGIVVDPQRDVDRFLDAGGAEGTRIRFVLETHVHNDYVSGG